MPAGKLPDQVRLLVSIVAATVVVLHLFWLMQAMISTDKQQLNSKVLQMTEFIRLERETKLIRKRREKLPKPKKRPPIIKTPIAIAKPNPTPPKISPPNLNINMPSNSRFNPSLLGGVTIGVQRSGALIPLVRIPPRYPMRASNRRIEGWVKLEFTITEVGTVADAVVVQANPRGVFDNSALQAIKRWKFKPQIVNGKPTAIRADQLLEFKLER